MKSYFTEHRLVHFYILQYVKKKLVSSLWFVLWNDLSSCSAEAEVAFFFNNSQTFRQLPFISSRHHAMQERELDISLSLTFTLSLSLSLLSLSLSLSLFFCFQSLCHFHQRVRWRAFLWRTHPLTKKACEIKQAKTTASAAGHLDLGQSEQEVTCEQLPKMKVPKHFETDLFLSAQETSWSHPRSKSHALCKFSAYEITNNTNQSARRGDCVRWT